MKDRIPTYPGRVKLTPVSGQTNTYDMVRADEPTQEGTPLNKNTLLRDATAEALGLTADATVDEVLGALNVAISGRAQVVTGTYTGTGAYGSYSDSTKYNTLTFDFEPKVVFIGDSTKTFRITTSGHGFIAVKGLEEKWESTVQANPRYRFVDNSVQWCANSAAAQYNTSGTIYAYVAIG